MGMGKTWIDLVVFAAVVTVVSIVLFTGINALESTKWMLATQEHTMIGVISVIFAIAIVNVGILIGVGVCKLRFDRRHGRPGTRLEIPDAATLAKLAR